MLSSIWLQKNYWRFSYFHEKERVHKISIIVAGNKRRKNARKEQKRETWLNFHQFSPSLEHALMRGDDVEISWLIVIQASIFSWSYLDVTRKLFFLNWFINSE